MRWLVSHGAEIGNHTYDHANLSALTTAQQLAEIGNEQAYIAKEIPGYSAVSFAYPYGALPNWQTIAENSYEGTSWAFKYLALVGSGPIAKVPATFPANLQRIQVTNPSLVKHPQWRDLVWSSWQKTWLPTAHLYTVIASSSGSNQSAKASS